MGRVKSTDKQTSSSTVHELSLPPLPQSLEGSLGSGETLRVAGTNVIRVPFGIRQSRKKKPQRPETLVTLVLPLQPQGQPTPPPQAA